MAVPFKKMPALLTAAFPAGLSVPVPYRLRYSDKRGGFSYNIPAGRQTLRTPGLMALLRDRYSDPKKRGEAARVANWRRFFIEARREMSRPANLTRLRLIATQARRTFMTDLSEKELAGLFSAFVVAPEFSTSYLPARSSYANRQWKTQIDSRVAQLRARLALRGIIVPSDARFWVLNGTDTPGLANKISLRLTRDFGLKAMTGNARGLPLRHTIIEFSRPDLEPLAHEVAADLRGDALVQATASNVRLPIIAITLGSEAAAS